MLRVELAVWKDEAESEESCRALRFAWVKGLWPVDGRRDSRLMAGEEERLVDELTISERRACWSWARSLLMAAIGSWASEADRSDR